MALSTIMKCYDEGMMRDDLSKRTNTIIIFAARFWSLDLKRGMAKSITICIFSSDICFFLPRDFPSFCLLFGSGRLYFSSDDSLTLCSSAICLFVNLVALVEVDRCG